MPRWPKPMRSTKASTAAESCLVKQERELGSEMSDQRKPRLLSTTTLRESRVPWIRPWPAKRGQSNGYWTPCEPSTSP